MFSVSKILALAAILGAVWYGFKLIGRLDDARSRKAERSSRGNAGRPAPRPGPAEDEDVLDLVKDESGNYVAKNKRNDQV